jgi:hypothetical protein
MENTPTGGIQQAVFGAIAETFQSALSGFQYNLLQTVQQAVQNSGR